MSSGLIPPSSMIISQLVAPSGTRMPLHQAAAPLGWTQDVSAGMNDTAMRVNNSSPTTGGSAGFSTWYISGAQSVNSFTLSTLNMAVHNHTFTTNPSHQHGVNNASDSGFAENGVANGDFQTTNVVFDIVNKNAGSDINSAGISLGSAGSGASITPTYTTPAVQYCDLIMAVKQ